MKQYNTIHVILIDAITITPNKTLSLFQYAKLHQPILHLNEEDNLFSKHINIFINNIRISSTSSRRDSLPICSQRQTHRLNDIPSTNSKSAINQNHSTPLPGATTHVGSWPTLGRLQH